MSLVPSGINLLPRDNTWTGDNVFSEGLEVAAGKNLDFGDDGECYLYRGPGLSPAFWFANKTGGGVSFYATDGSGGMNPPSSLFGINEDLDCKVLCASGKKMLLLEQSLNEIPLITESHLLALDDTGALVAADSLADTPGDFVWTGAHDFSSATLTLPTIDISSDTNLAVSAPITLTGDTVGFDFSTNNTWTGNHAFGSDGNGVDIEFFSDTSGASMVFDPDAAGGESLLTIEQPAGADASIKIQATRANAGTGNFWAMMKAVGNLTQASGGKSVNIVNSYELNDNRIVDSTSGFIEFMRAVDFKLSRGASFSSDQSITFPIQAFHFDVSDVGTRSGTTVGNDYISLFFVESASGFSPVITNATNSPTYGVNLIKANFQIGSNNAGAANLESKLFDVAYTTFAMPGFLGFADLDLGLIRFKPNVSSIGSPWEMRVIDYQPTIGGTTASTEHDLIYATAGHIRLLADDTSLIQGAGSDFEQYFDGANQIFDVATGSEFQFHVNSTEAVSFGASTFGARGVGAVAMPSAYTSGSLSAARDFSTVSTVADLAAVVETLVEDLASQGLLQIN